jgi:hypothetical protein
MEEEKKHGNDDYKPEFGKQMVSWFENKRTLGEPAFFSDYAKTIPSTDPKSLSGHVSHATLINWTKRYPEFFEAYTICKDEQKSDLVSGGLTGRYNPSFTHNTLKNCDVNWRDESKVESSIHLDGVIRLPAKVPLGSPPESA